MIKENILRKNLLTNEIDCGSVDSIFEIQNLAGNIIAEHPYIEIKEGSEDYSNFYLSKTKNIKLAATKEEAKKRILTKYPESKQINYLADTSYIQYKEAEALAKGETYTKTEAEVKCQLEAYECKIYINNIRNKSNELEKIIELQEDYKALEAIDISDDKYWLLSK